MLEILLLVFLGKRLGTILRAKGRSAGWMQALLVVCWFGGEIIGGMAVVVMDQMRGGSGQFDAGVYIGCLLGAIGGTVIVFVIAKSLAPLGGYHFNAFPVVSSRPPAPPI
jgi:hypothetical protein